MARATWYFAEAQRSAGPITWDALLAAARRGELTPHGQVWSPGIDSWVTAGDLPWLFGTTTAPLSSEMGSDANRDQAVATPPPLKGTAFARTRKPSPIGAFHLQPAPPLHRLGIFGIDSLVLTLLTAAVGIPLRLVLERNAMIGAETTSGELIQLVFLVSLLLYHVGVESLTGTSVGKRLLGYRLVDATGETPFATRIVVRSIARSVTAVAVLVVGVGLTTGTALGRDREWFAVAATLLLATTIAVCVRERRALHDFVGGTWLVRR